MTREKLSPDLVIGWREWLALPDLDVPYIKAKVDTGARTSALHAVDVEPFERRGRSMVRFTIHPLQRSIARSVDVETDVIELRRVVSSNGVAEVRPVIETVIALGEHRWTAELTLTRRDVMGFRMLLGRQAIRGHAVVDPGNSYRLSSPPRRKRRKPRDAGGRVKRR